MTYVISVVKDNLSVSEVWDNNGKEVGRHDGRGLKRGRLPSILHALRLPGRIADSFIL